MKHFLLKTWLTMICLLIGVGSAWAETVTVTDDLNQEFTGISGTAYTDFSGKAGTSGAVYAGNCAGGNSSIQLRSSNSNSGIITTVSGGKVRKITVEWNSNTANGRSLNIYGKNEVYTSAADLYNDNTSGNQLGQISCGTSTTKTITGDYKYIGIRSNSGAMYLTSITIEWEKDGSTPVTHTAKFYVNGEQEGETQTLENGAAINFPSTPADINGKTFAGWSESTIIGTTNTAPTFVSSANMGDADKTYYAVFATKTGSAAVETKTQTLEYDTWTYGGSTTDKTKFRLFHDGGYIESASFDRSKLTKVVVYGGTFGGTSYNKLTIGDGTNTWKSVTVSGSSETGKNSFTEGTALSGNGPIRITSNSGSASGSGVRISKVEIYTLEGGYSYSDYCTTVGPPKTLTSIAVSSTPAKTLYKVGEAFSTAGMTVMAYYDDDTNVEVNDYTVSKTGALATTDNVITISYTEGGITKTADVAIDVVALDHIAVTTAPSKTEYTEGESFDDTGMVVTATWGTEEGKTISEAVAATVTGGDILEVGTTGVTISYTHEGTTKTTTQDITVNALPRYSATFYVNGEQSGEAQSLKTGDPIVFPADPADIADKTFVGWTIAEIDGTQDEEPSMVSSATMGTANMTFYAVFAAKTSGTGSGSSVDVLTRETTGIDNGATSYSGWTNKSVAGGSNAIYAGNSAGSNNSIQLRSTNPSGIISTTSGGTISKVSVEWESHTSNGRVVDVYGSNDAYSSSADLYDNTARGTKLGSITYGTTPELTVSGEYKYIGIRSNSGAQYISSITIEWQSGTPDTFSEYCTTVDGKVLESIAVKTAPTKVTYTEGENFDPTGLVITATYDNDETEDVAYDGNESKFSFTPALTTALAITDDAVTITYGGQNTTQSITVNERAKYTVTIDNTHDTNGTISVWNGHVELASGALVLDGTVLTIKYEVTTEFYRFLNWQYKDNSVSKYTSKWKEFDYTVNGSDVSFRITFEEIPLYTITYYVNGVPTTEEVREGATLNFPANPTMAGKVFRGWIDQVRVADSSQKPDFVTATTAHGNATFFAVFATEINTTSYTDFTTNMDVIVRSEVQDKYFTICYPRAIHKDAHPGATAYNIVGKTLNGEERIATLELEEETGHLVAGRPYFMVGDKTAFNGYHSLDNDIVFDEGEDAVDNNALEAGNHNGLYGVFADFAFNSPDSGWAANEYYVIYSNKVQAGTRNSGVKANRAFIKKSEIHAISSQSAARYVIELEEGTLTELDEVELKPIETSIYNLQGQRINRAEKGVYIVNGRKVIR